MSLETMLEVYRINQHSLSQKSVEPSKKIDTQRELANTAGVSHDTIHKVEKIEEKALEEVKRQLSSGETIITKRYPMQEKQTNPMKELISLVLVRRIIKSLWEYIKKYLKTGQRLTKNTKSF